MRILQIVAFVGPGNPYGGPVTVAVNQSEEPRGRGPWTMFELTLFVFLRWGPSAAWVRGFRFVGASDEFELSHFNRSEGTPVRKALGSLHSQCMTI